LGKDRNSVTSLTCVAPGAVVLTARGTVLVGGAVASVGDHLAGGALVLACLIVRAPVAAEVVAAVVAVRPDIARASRCEVASECATDGLAGACVVVGAETEHTIL